MRRPLGLLRRLPLSVSRLWSSGEPHNYQQTHYHTQAHYSGYTPLGMTSTTTTGAQSGVAASGSTGGGGTSPSSAAATVYSPLSWATGDNAGHAGVKQQTGDSCTCCGSCCRRETGSKKCPWFGDEESLWARHKAFYLMDVPLLLCLPLAIARLLMNQVFAYLVAVALIISVLVAVFHTLECSLVYAVGEPCQSRYQMESPETHGFTTWEPVRLRPDGITGPVVTGFLLLRPTAATRATAPTVLVLHGNAGNIGHRLAFCSLVYEAAQANVFIIDYRGYGHSTGRPSEAGLYRDARAALAYLTTRNDINPYAIFAFGRSLGGAVAINLATHPLSRGRLKGLILENTFTSLPEMSHRLFGGLLGPLTPYLLPWWSFINQFTSLAKVQRLTDRNSLDCRVLLLSGAVDNLVPPAMMLKLAGAFASVVRDPGESHTSASANIPAAPAVSATVAAATGSTTNLAGATPNAAGSGGNLSGVCGENVSMGSISSGGSDRLMASMGSAAAASESSTAAGRPKCGNGMVGDAETGSSEGVGGASLRNSSFAMGADPRVFAQSGCQGMVLFPNGNHNDTWTCTGWFAVVARFVAVTMADVSAPPGFTQSFGHHATTGNAAETALSV